MPFKSSLFLVVALIFASAAQASAATITVTSTANATGGPDCTLRDAITAANGDAAEGGCGAGSGADTIGFTLPDPSVIDLGSGLGTALPNANSDITFDGPGSEALTIGSTTPNSLNFTLLTQQSGTLNVSGVTLKGADRSGYVGGGIQQPSGSTGDLTIDDVVITGNSSDCGAGIRLEGEGEVSITNSIIAENEGIVCTAAVSVTTPAETIVTIEGTSIVGNSSPDNGAMYNQGETTIVNSTIADNSSSGNTGGITNYGELTITNSTFTGNTAVGNVGVLNASAGSVTMNNSTVSGNSAGGASGAIAQSGGTFTIANSIVSSNTAASGPDCAGAITSEGYNLIGSLSDCTLGGDTTGNLIGADPLLEPLGDNEGPTQTMALGAGSPALGAANPGPLNGALDGTLRNCEPTDQRSELRTEGSCDIGAWQYPARPPEPTPTPTPSNPTQPVLPAISKLTVSAAKPRRPVNRLIFTFDLSEAASVEMVVQRKFGRLQRQKCKRTTKKTQTRKRCPIYRQVSTRTFQAPSGKSQTKLDVKGLNPGAYRVSLIATNANGVSSPARIIFYRPWW